MPLVYSFKPFPSVAVYMWKVLEEDAYFLHNMPWHQKQIEWLNHIHPIKRMEYLASRYLIYKQTGILDSHLYKDESGKLHIAESDLNLSLSHSGEWIGLAVSSDQVGIDLQKPSSKILRVSERFLNNEEFNVLRKMADEKILILAWTIKEAVYKAHGKKPIHFARQIKLDLTEIKKNNSIPAAVISFDSNEKKYNIYHEWRENFGFSIALQTL